MISDCKVQRQWILVHLVTKSSLGKTRHGGGCSSEYHVVAEAKGQNVLDAIERGGVSKGEVRDILAFARRRQDDASFERVRSHVWIYGPEGAVETLGTYKTVVVVVDTYDRQERHEKRS